MELAQLLTEEDKKQRRELLKKNITSYHGFDESLIVDLDQVRREAAKKAVAKYIETGKVCY